MAAVTQTKALAGCRAFAFTKAKPGKKLGNVSNGAKWTMKRKDSYMVEVHFGVLTRLLPAPAIHPTQSKYLSPRTVPHELTAHASVLLYCLHRSAPGACGSGCL